MSNVLKFQNFKQWECESDRLVDQKIDLFSWTNILTFQPNRFFYLSAPSIKMSYMTLTFDLYSHILSCH